MIAEKLREKFYTFSDKPLNTKITILLPYFIVCFFTSRIVELYRLCGRNIGRCLRNFSYIYKTFPQCALQDLLKGIAAGVLIIWLFKGYNKLHGKNERLGEEYGSARWGNHEDIASFIDKDPYNNIILSQTEMLSMKARMPKFNLNRNKHVVVYGGSGSGKTYGFVKPNLYQLHSSYVLTDPNR